MNKIELINHWIEYCSDFKEIRNKGLCCIHKFIYTFDIVTNLDEDGYLDKWCYESLKEAQIALEHWNGIGDPPGLWIKYKGVDGEYGNINRTSFDLRYDVISPHYKSK